MDTGLKDRVVIVAASSQGIGRATAEGFAREGAKLGICSRNPTSIQQAGDEIRRRHHVEVVAEVCDVTDAQSVHYFVENIARQFGRVDVCVTNAGGPPSRGFLAASVGEWQRTLETNFMSVVYFARHVIPLMQKNHWGRLITLTSFTVKQPLPDLVLSNAVRAAVVGLVKSLSNEFGKDGILVNNVGPGYTATERLRELGAARGIREDEFFRSMAADSAVGRLARPQEIADAVVWLASERASMVTGQTILVDGGSYKGL